jgi:hypothetical protein
VLEGISCLMVPQQLHTPYFLDHTLSSPSQCASWPEEINGLRIQPITCTRRTPHAISDPSVILLDSQRCQYNHSLNVHQSHDCGALLHVGTTWMQLSLALKNSVTKGFPIQETAVSMLYVPTSNEHRFLQNGFRYKNIYRK